ncbi:MAG: DUF4387 domain-containing protein [Sphingopyxis sp.]|uniref:DUF4387 family protein n=1 Tax=Sphingopyxis sp. TaxID=1908224 RepID=UPI001A220105|nr:DUF4387 family protein [Sphingopyxis sp.]MBJ7498429.1 DUF4387 domain-containing protein [Sphingopyxis sp.]
MTRLADLAPGIKGRNAGAAWLTFDIPFSDRASYERALASGAISPRRIGEIYAVPEADVRVFPFAPALALKITIPRAAFAGGFDESDFDGAQQFAPILDIEIP